MNKEIISTKEAYYIAIIYILGTSIILGQGRKSMQDIWISTIVAMVFAIPMVLIFAKIVFMHPGKNLYEILNIVFGKIIGNFFSILFIWYFFHLGSLAIRDITEFVQVVSFQDTPQYFPAIFIGLLAVFMIKSGIEVLGRWTNFVLPFVLFLIFTIQLLSIRDFKYENIKPILYYGWMPVFHDAYTTFTFPFADSVVFIALFKSLRETKKVYKVYIVGILVGGFVLLTSTFKNMFVLGFPIVTNNYFPSYYTNMVIQFGFLQRIEAISSTILVLCGFVKISVCLFAVCIGISHLFNFQDYKDVAVPISFMAVALSLVLYSNTMEMLEFIEVYRFYVIPFQIILPILTLIFGFIKKKKDPINKL